MKKLLSVTISSLCLASIAGFAHAEEYYSSTAQNDGGYSSSTTPSDGGYSSSGTTAQQSSSVHKHARSKFTVYVNIPSPTPGYIVNEGTTYVVATHKHRHHYKNLQWISMNSGSMIPEDSVLGGAEANNESDLFICRGNYNGGVHPGKVVRGNCNISWGGREIPLRRYQVLVSPSHLRWISAENGALPRHAVQGGYEQGRPLYICQTQYKGGIHPGKVVGANCNIAWGGEEIAVPYYNVLVS